MKYVVARRPEGAAPFKLGGVTYPEGGIVELFGRRMAEFFGDQLIAVTDPALIRALEVSHPMYVASSFTWGRRQYQVGDIYWAATRSDARRVGAHLRPATGAEVLTWLEQQPQAPVRRPPITDDAPAAPTEDPGLEFRPARQRLPSRKEREAAKAAAEAQG